MVELQNAVVDPRFHEFSWRHQQNWIGDDLGYRQQVDFVPARPEDLPTLMQGLLDTAAKAREVIDSESARGGSEAGEPLFDPVVYAAIIAFGFVFIHPFMDGNGRIHRYLIHEVLTNAGFTPRGIVLPVSAVILTNLEEYVSVLESYSRPVRQRTEYSPDPSGCACNGERCSLFQCTSMPRNKLSFFIKRWSELLMRIYSRRLISCWALICACRELNQLLDWPNHSLELFVRVVHQNEGKLSNSKKQSHFSWMTEAEIGEAEAVVCQAFSGTD